MNKRLSLGIVIPTKNSEKYLELCLKSIFSQIAEANLVKVIVVDQNSTDSTRLLAQKYGCEVLKVKGGKIYQPPSQSRNLGAKRLDTDLIWHLDSDMRLQEGLIDEIIAAFENDPKLEIVGAIIPEQDVPKNFWAKGKAFERSLYYHTEFETARVFRKKIFDAIGGYDSQITSGEDWYINQKLLKKGRLIRTQKCVYHEIGEISLRQEFKKKFFYGYSSSNYLKKSQTNISSQMKKLLILYSKGILRNFFSQPCTIFSFLVIRIVDFIALFSGLLKFKLSQL